MVKQLYLFKNDGNKIVSITGTTDLNLVIKIMGFFYNKTETYMINEGIIIFNKDLNENEVVEILRDIQNDTNNVLYWSKGVNKKINYFK